MAQIADTPIEPSLPVWKKLLYGAISTVVVLLALAIVAEIALRVFVVFVPSFRSAPFRQYDPVLGESLIPSVRVNHSRGCFQGLVVTNQWGFRDRERTLEKPPGEFRIALVGDSVVEAAQVQPGQVMNIKMEELLAASGRKNNEVLSFGIEGIGTTQELLLYKEKVRQFHPDLVVLMFVDNDIMNNSSTIQPKAYGIRTWYAPYYNLGPNGGLVFQPVQRDALWPVGSFLERHFLLTYYIEHAAERINIGNSKWQGLPLEWQVYATPEDPEWSNAWTVTERVLKLMQDAVAGDGAKFVVIKHPSFSDIAPDWRERFEKSMGTIPPNLDPATVQRGLQDISKRDNIPIDFMAPYMQAYRDSHHLQFPYFSYTCETHFAPLGHEVAAEAIIQDLAARHLLPPANSPSATSMPPNPRTSNSAPTQ
jgi:hypothetical protein